MPIPRRDAGALAALSLLSTMGAATPQLSRTCELKEDLSINECYPPSFEGEEPLTLASLAAPRRGVSKAGRARCNRCCSSTAAARGRSTARTSLGRGRGRPGRAGAYRLAVGSRGLALLDDDDVFGADFRRAVGDVASWSSTGDSGERCGSARRALLVESAQAAGSWPRWTCIRARRRRRASSQRRDWTRLRTLFGRRGRARRRVR